MIAEILRLVETENSKRKRKSAAQSKMAKAVKKTVEKEVEEKLVTLRKEKKKKKKKNEAVQPKPFVVLKVGDKVRMLDGKSVGSIDAIEKKKAIVNYGIFTTQVNLDQLELAK